ncbi:chemotaxis protein CheB [Pricia sp. S334]|uniref:protein-glutamate O-methyltransferase n=1 Tax=Pricia mediterranea TaxID=3076079 RepID=A0ABU3L2T9_9FLAO|nr:chemotaxis protein CheB [Pricia sp. S334]MDT7827611.1 chemotaxis protein CheB [Pricia sp. S334]
MAKANYSKEFPLVGVGASAGGVDSFKKFLGAIPDNSGMAYILVQHLSPSHDSILPEILRRTSRLPVQEISDDCHLEADHVYVIPENKLLEVTDHSLNLVPREEGQHHMPIDKFFGSLARRHGKLAVGVVLSGTANDGTAGLREIKEHGGITFAEDPESAAWPGMPRSAVEAGVVDFILASEDIPPKLVKVRANFEGGTDHEDGEERHIDGEGLQKILSVVRQKSGVDFNYYKKPTISRRIGRRMAINQMAHHVDYHELLKDDPKEQELLFQDMLIKVTSFFRDPEIFAKLEEEIFPKLLKERSGEDTIRIWVAGCATGEEVFSLAMCLFDALEASGIGRYKGPKIQIFASDISEPVIKKARSGIYSQSELETVSEERRNRYFNRTDGNFRVIKSIRDSVVFTVHNFLMDPPFRSVDLISCRNVFIYLEPFLQKKALSTFHYALKENGFLLMGKSESVAKPTDYFVPYSKNEKIYSRKAGEGRFEPAQTATKQPLLDLGDKKEKISPPAKTDFRKSADRKLVTEYTPASLIVDAHYEIVHINGHIEPFVTPQSGRPTHELLKTARKELAFELRNALRKVKESEKKVRKEGVPVKTEWEEFSVDFEIVPLIDIVEPHYLILFWKSSEDRSFYEEVRKMLEPVFPVKGKSEVRQRNEALEKELEQLREDMRGISEEQEAHNEELQSGLATKKRTFS